jgi:hypothetical protein
MALCSKAIDEIRREQQNRCNAVGLRTLKGQRFLLLKNFEKLGTNEKSSLEAFFGGQQTPGNSAYNERTIASFLDQIGFS